MDKMWLVKICSNFNLLCGQPLSSKIRRFDTCLVYSELRHSFTFGTMGAY